MLTIRLARIGKRNKAQFQIVLQEHTVAPGGKHVEVLGSYDPHSKKEVLKVERIKYWVTQGAQISDTAYNLFISKGVLTGEKRKVKLPAKKVEEAKEAPAAAIGEVKAEVAEVPVVEEKKEPASAEASAGKETPVDKTEALI